VIVFSDEITQRCVALHGVNPNHSYAGFMEAIRLDSSIINRLLTDIETTRVDLPRLTPREIDVLLRLCNGRTYPQIGADLWITHETVKSHMRNIRGKLGVPNSTGAVALALCLGLLTQDQT
jgi:DNA-binding CsgD family transcriptional regulator